MTDQNASPTQLASEAEQAMKVLDNALRQGSAFAAEELDREGLRKFRRIRRQWARFHADASEFADEYLPDVTVLSGGT